ncbi:hypothetical protein EP331_08615 [bacterium]|nr:MAG: hypothetical protein EP331_08615 [bacterium]
MIQCSQHYQEYIIENKRNQTNNSTTDYYNNGNNVIVSIVDDQIVALKGEVVENKILLNFFIENRSNESFTISPTEIYIKGFSISKTKKLIKRSNDKGSVYEERVIVDTLITPIQRLRPNELISNVISRAVWEQLMIGFSDAVQKYNVSSQPTSYGYISTENKVYSFETNSNYLKQREINEISDNTTRRLEDSNKRSAQQISSMKSSFLLKHTLKKMDYVNGAVYFNYAPSDYYHLTFNINDVTHDFYFTLAQKYE